MASTHASGSLLASVANTAGSTATSSTLDNTVSYGAVITTKITNGGTGPTIGCSATINISPDNATWYFWSSQTAGTVLSVVYTLPFTVPPEAKYAQVVFTGNTGQSVTVEAQYQQLTGI